MSLDAHNLASPDQLITLAASGYRLHTDTYQLAMGRFDRAPADLERHEIRLLIEELEREERGR